MYTNNYSKSVPKYLKNSKKPPYLIAFLSLSNTFMKFLERRVNHIDEKNVCLIT